MTDKELKEILETGKVNLEDMETHTESEHRPTDESFTVTVDTHDVFYREEGGAPERQELKASGYMVAVFNEGGKSSFHAQGKTSLVLLLHNLLKFTSPKKLKHALAGATVMAMMDGRVDPREIFGDDDED